MFECLGDSDFLAKLHCIRQAFQVNSKKSDFICLVKPKVCSFESVLYLCKHFYNKFCN